MGYRYLGAVLWYTNHAQSSFSYISNDSHSPSTRCLRSTCYSLSHSPPLQTLISNMGIAFRPNALGDTLLDASVNTIPVLPSDERLFRSFSITQTEEVQLISRHFKSRILYVVASRRAANQDISSLGRLAGYQGIQGNRVKFEGISECCMHVYTNQCACGHIVVEAIARHLLNVLHDHGLYGQRIDASRSTSMLNFATVVECLKANISIQLWSHIAISDQHLSNKRT